MAKDYGLISAKEYENAPYPPDLTVAEGKKTEEWHRSCVRYFSTFYNVYRSPYGQTNTNRMWEPPVNRIYRNFMYIKGEQDSRDYAFFTPDFQGSTQDELGIVPGKKIASLTDFMRGQCAKMIDNLRLEAICISPDAKTKEMEIYERLLFSVEMNQMLSEMEEQDGLSYTPAGEQFQPEVKEDVIRWMEKDFKEMMQSAADLIAKGILYENNFKQLFLKAFTHVIASGMCGIDVEVRGGKIVLQHIPSWYAIPDTSVDNDFNEDARFAGYINFLTPSEIFSRYACTDVEKGLINDLSTQRQTALGSTNLTWEMLNSTNGNFTWWDQKLSQPLVAVVKMYWKCRQDLNYKTKTDQFGATKVVKTDYTVKKSEFEMEGWQQATLIGNIVLKNFGSVPNRVGLFEKNIKNDCPIKYFLPNMNMGGVVSIVDKLRYHQDMIDALRRKIIDLAAKDLGYVTTIAGSATGNIHVEKILADWKINSVTVINDKTGEPYDDNQLRNLLMSSKIGGSDYIKEYMMYIDQEKREMEEIVNIPRIALGQQQTYTGLGVQQNTIDQSTLGLYTLYNGFVQWGSALIQYASNVAKWVYTIDDSFAARVQVGDLQFKYLKLTRDIRLEEIGVYFKVQDTIDDTAKQRLMSIALADAQNGKLDSLDVIMIQNAQTYTELKNDLEYTIKRKERKEQEKEALMQIMQASQQQQQMSLQAEQAQLQAATSRQNTQDKIQADVLQTAMKEDPSMIQAM